MTSRIDGPLRSFAIVAGVMSVAFAMNVACEVAIAAANRQNNLLRTEIAGTAAALERASKLSSKTNELQRHIATLHLRDSGPQQCLIMVAELQRLSTLHNLRLTSVVRDVISPVARRIEPDNDSYEITLEGTYPAALAALAGLGELPLVVNVKAISFERLPQVHRPARDVRVSIQLEVFRMTKNDAARSS